MVRIGLVLLNSHVILNNKRSQSYKYVIFEALEYAHIEYFLLCCPQTITNQVRYCAIADVSV